MSHTPPAGRLAALLAIACGAAASAQTTCAVDRDGDGSGTFFDVLDSLRDHDAGWDFGGVPAPASGVPNVMLFRADAPGDPGKSVETWGVDTAWPDERNIRLSVSHMGVENVDVVRMNFFVDEPLTAQGKLGPSSRRAAVMSTWHRATGS